MWTFTILIAFCCRKKKWSMSWPSCSIVHIVLYGFSLSDHTLIFESFVFRQVNEVYFTNKKRKNWIGLTYTLHGDAHARVDEWKPANDAIYRCRQMHFLWYIAIVVDFFCFVPTLLTVIPLQGNSKFVRHLLVKYTTEAILTYCFPFNSIPFRTQNYQQIFPYTVCRTTFVTFCIFNLSYSLQRPSIKDMFIEGGGRRKSACCEFHNSLALLLYLFIFNKPNSCYSMYVWCHLRGIVQSLLLLLLWYWFHVIWIECVGFFFSYFILLAVLSITETSIN